ncbi:DUF4384 domain-containing protein [Desulfosudis oleivorans]|uniref:DUF4384 domain-containing protein n=1 Tax=Desulfosudis oleivorans (strain DSM 6200 / JCM 39069 / Hxd3) TaxID=96561 RepID=A8ZTU2_DESOH|nr:DUF4384 domain-containing protein [Desulfosudis oleivorans]ABW67875.1 hypothetical protein Dole_2071 [Desulfosudis oleivorans Hxd3]
MEKQPHTQKQFMAAFIWIFLLATLVLLAPQAGMAGNSIITTGSGVAALGNDKSRNQTESEALALAKRDAAEKAATHVQSASEVENFALKTDLVKAYAEAVVTVLEKLESDWIKDPQMGDSFHVVIRAEVAPNLKGVRPAGPWADDPAAPLTVSLTSPKKDYRADEQVTLFLKGNKPFFARVVYEDCSGTLTQILPNPYRTENYFQGDTVYQLPAGNDRYTMTVVPPFGTEKITVYAATQPLGEVAQQTRGPVYLLEEKPDAVAARTRGIQLSAAPAGEKKTAAEFFETAITIQTGP